VQSAGLLATASLKDLKAVVEFTNVKLGKTAFPSPALRKP